MLRRTFLGILSLPLWPWKKAVADDTSTYRLLPNSIVWLTTPGNSGTYTIIPRHGTITVRNCSGRKIETGDAVKILPNGDCVRLKD